MNPLWGVSPLKGLGNNFVRLPGLTPWANLFRPLRAWIPNRVNLSAHAGEDSLSPAAEERTRPDERALSVLGTRNSVLRVRHLFRPYQLVKLLSCQEAELEGGFAQAAVLDVRCVRDFRRLVIADLGSERRHQHE